MMEQVVSCNQEFEVQSPLMVDANIKRWTITSDNIYLMKFGEAPPQWLEDMIDDILIDTGLVDDVADLNAKFANFEEGYTNHFYDWMKGDEHLMATIETLYVTSASYSAGIQELWLTSVSEFESKATVDFTIAAWMSGGAGGAWFNERVSVVSNVAYSAAKSASTLTASLSSQQDQLDAIVGDIDVLEKQVDGKVVTWFVADAVNPNNPEEPYDTMGPVITTPGEDYGKVNPNGKPYWCWSPNNTCAGNIYNDDTTEDTRAEHTGDTYVYYEYDVNGVKQILSTWRFGKDPYALEDDPDQGYNWFIFTDDLATSAYEAALRAQVTADGKINSYYQTTPPTILEDPTLGEGDIWIDEDGDAQTGAPKNSLYRYSVTLGWQLVRDVDIKASVDRLDEATVTIDGQARAKSSLNIQTSVNGRRIASGFVGEADNESSSFRIYADDFIVAESAGQDADQVPFRIVDGHIYFNGRVEFENIDDVPDTDLSNYSTFDDLAGISSKTTIIDGGNITTGTMNAKLVNVINLNAESITAGSIYNTGGHQYDYTMRINLDEGEIHIK